MVLVSILFASIALALILIVIGNYIKNDQSDYLVLAGFILILIVGLSVLISPASIKTGEETTYTYEQANLTYTNTTYTFTPDQSALSDFLGLFLILLGGSGIVIYSMWMYERKWDGAYK